MVRRIGVGKWVVGVILGLVCQAASAAEDPVQAAIDRGVAYLKQPYLFRGEENAGANALIGLALLECGVPANDPAVERIAGLVRAASPSLNHTYSLALAVMFLDRLDDTGDVPLIQAMTVRLLAGQNGAGGWTYHCPTAGVEEANRLNTLVMRRNELRGAREVPPAPARAERRDAPLPAEIRNQLQNLERRGPLPVGHRPHDRDDNSNTQFAILGLWVGHRHGVPVERALRLTDQRFRQSQNASGGWGYHVHISTPPTPSMTCAGLLGLALGHGVVNEAVLRTAAAADPKKTKTTKKPRDPGQDLAVQAGLRALATAIGHPAGQGKPVPVIPHGQLAPRTEMNKRHAYYFLWSLERVAVIYDLRTIGHKDWYAWGSEILVASQDRDGSWQADYEPPIDTCFALLFLKRANLAQDLTATLKGKVKDPGEVALKASGVGGEAVKDKGLQPVVDLTSPAKTNRPPAPEKKGTAPAAVPAPQQPDVEAQAARLSATLIKAPPTEQAKLLDEFQKARGVAYTQAIAATIPKLTAEIQAKARDALAERLMRMTAATLRDRLTDDDPEMRVAAARACAGKGDLAHVPDLIARLDDANPRVARAARTALKVLAEGKDFGPAPDATAAERARAVEKWQQWWKDRKPR